jgi:prepilin-type N-terminal cleavage/methylation domain-containing protein
MIDKIKNRLASEQGFTLIELLVVMVILGILVAIAVPSYLSLTSKAKVAAASANVRSAIPGAEILYQQNGNYTGLNRAAILTVEPGIGPHVKAGANTNGDGYCIQDSEDGDVTFYSYTGGVGGTSTIAVGACAASYAVS